MNLKDIRGLLAISIILALVMALIPIAAADDSGSRYDWSKHHEIERIDVVKVYTGQSGNTISSQVTSMAITGKKDKTAIITFPKPITTSYNTKYSFGYASTKDITSADIAVRPLSNATLSVAGASLVGTVKDARILLNDKEYFIFEYRKIGIYLPDGTGREFKLDKPVKVIYNKDRKTLTVDAYPALYDTLGSYVGTATFPSSAPPVKITDIESAERAGGIQTIGTAPLAPSPSPTTTPTPTPTAGP